MTNEKYFLKTISQWEFDYGLFTDLPRVIVTCSFSPSSFKLKRWILTSLDKICIYSNLKSTCHIKLKCFLWTKLLENLLLANYLFICCSFKILRSINFAIFDSYLSYHRAWDHKCSAIQQIVILQRKTVRIINVEPRNFHTSPLFKQNAILKFQCKICLENILFVSKCLIHSSVFPQIIITIKPQILHRVTSKKLRYKKKYRKLRGFLLMFSISFTSFSVLLLFPLSITFFVVLHGFWFYFI